MITITGITPPETDWLTAPESGWPIMVHCSVCKCTYVFWDSWLVKPRNGGMIWRVEGFCVHEENGLAHMAIANAMEAQGRLRKCH